MDEKKFVNNIYAYLKLQKEGINEINFNDNKKLLTDLSKELFKIHKLNCDTNIIFVFKDKNCFSIYSEDNCLNFTLDLSLVDYYLLSDLLFGKIKCSEFLIRNSKTVCNIPVDYRWSEYVFNALKTWDGLLDRISYKEDNFIVSDEASYARQKIRESHILWCYNKSCTGKTFLGIYSLTYCNELRIVFNPSIKTSCNLTLLKLIIEFGINCAILIDDIQCDVEFAKELFDYIKNNLLSIKKRNISLFIISWSSLAQDVEFSKYKMLIPVIEANPQKFVALLRNRLKNKQFLNVCEDNLALISTAIRLERSNVFIANNNSDYTKAVFHSFVKTDDREQLKLIHILAVLGTYEFETPLLFIRSFGNINLSLVVTAKVIEDSIFLAHRTISNFIARYIENDLCSHVYERKDIIKRYINYINSSSKWKALLHLLGENRKNDILSVSPIWNLMYEIQENLQNQTAIDPSWNNTPSSMYFVISIANMLGVTEEYRNVINALCSNFTIVDENIIVSFDKLKTTYDFVKIKERMIAEDESISEHNYEYGRELDLCKIHKNWLLGLLIGLKPILLNFGYKSLMLKIEQNLLESQSLDGYWYPKRVPWVTARILIGLAEAGYTINDEIIQKGVDYLVSCIQDGYWEAHTGGWNNVYETSSLCLEALIKCGVKYSESYIQNVVSFLEEHSDIWMSKNNEIDGATTACALIKVEGIQPALLNYINSLTSRNIHKIISSGKIDYNNEQSCNTTQIAYYVVELCWYILEKNIPELLDDFILRSEQEVKTVIMPKRQIFISYSEDSPTHVNKVRKIANYLEKEGYIVWFYDKMPLGTNNMEFMQKIDVSDITIIIGTKKYKEKSCEMKAGGVWFEACVLSREFMNNHYDQIIPLAFDEFNESFPEPFAINKGMRVKRIDERFLKTLSIQIKNKFS